MEKSIKTVTGDFSLYSQGIIHKKTTDHEKEFTALLVPKPHQTYVLHESHTCL